MTFSPEDETKKMKRSDTNQELLKDKSSPGTTLENIQDAERYSRIITKKKRVKFFFPTVQLVVSEDCVKLIPNKTE